MSSFNKDDILDDHEVNKKKKDIYVNESKSEVKTNTSDSKSEIKFNNIINSKLEDESKESDMNN
eukprot:jgi/Orpsp1_1/1189565/evm.model.d7180000072893.1